MGREIVADAMSGDREKCIASGTDDYLNKPARPEQVTAMLEKWVTREDGRYHRRGGKIGSGAGWSGAVNGCVSKMFLGECSTRSGLEVSFKCVCFLVIFKSKIIFDLPGLIFSRMKIFTSVVLF